MGVHSINSQVSYDGPVQPIPSEQGIQMKLLIALLEVFHLFILLINCVSNEWKGIGQRET